MKKQTNPKCEIHMVIDDINELLATTSQPEQDSLILQGVRNYKELQAEMDRALFAKPQDVHTLAEVMPQLQQLRERLASYGVHVQ